MTAAPQSCCLVQLNVFFFVFFFLMVVTLTYVTDPCPGNWLLEKTDNVTEMLMYIEFCLVFQDVYTEYCC